MAQEFDERHQVGQGFTWACFTFQHYILVSEDYWNGVSLNMRQFFISIFLENLFELGADVEVFEVRYLLILCENFYLFLAQSLLLLFFYLFQSFVDLILILHFWCAFLRLGCPFTNLLIRYSLKWWHILPFGLSFLPNLLPALLIFVETRRFVASLILRIFWRRFWRELDIC